MIRLLALAALLSSAPQDGKQPLGPRVPWTTSRITGSPEPPPPYRTRPAFPKLTFKKPVHLVPFPGHARYAVVEEDGFLWSIRNDPACEKPDLLLDLHKEIRNLDKVDQCKGVGSSYAIAFDPGFARNRWCYVMYVLAPRERKKPLPHGSRVSRFRVTETDPPRIDPDSEEILITWLSGGHNGCDLQFGNDGMLYLSTGDAEDPSPPDRLRTGQDCSDLLSSILRIDVRKPGPYAVPPDNPFADGKAGRPEIWCYGFRNPWRMSFDRKTGRLWVGDVGWERWELIFCAERGGNYGWSAMEGHEVCIPDAKRGPTPILPPAHVIPHPEAASITGGFVYRGTRLKGYEGRYIYGDWESRRLWANAIDGTTLGPREEIARTPHRIVAFAEDADGELLVVDYEGGGIHRLEPSDASARNKDFPRTLSTTGLFASVADQTPAPGVIPYAVNASRWHDGATARRWAAFPDLGAIQLIDKNRQWPKESIWPKDSVLAKTLTLEGRNVETQILHYDGASWNAYAYGWNAAGTDATLVAAEGATLDLGGGRRWRVPSRTACMTCHNPWPGTALTFNPSQLARPWADGKTGLTQIQAFQEWKVLPKPIPQTKPYVEPANEAASLDDRARSYLAVNCAHCHRFGGGGSAKIDLRHEIPVAEMKAAGERPTLGSFELADAHIVAPGDPGRSVLLYRISKLGQGRMPHLGSDVVDEKGAALLARWIASLPSADPPRGRPGLDRLRSGDLGALDLLLAGPTPALDLLGALDSLPETVRAEAVRRALDLPPGPVRDLFERFEPPGRRRERLGTSIRPERILGLAGDPGRGRRLFESSLIQCGKCHKIGGEALGPDLAKIGAKYTRAQLLESILEPSKTVDPKFAGLIVQTKSGDVLSGIVVSKNEKELVLRDVEREIRLAAGDVQATAPQQKSLMPDGLFQHLTAQEAADLLDFLASLK